MQLYTANLLNQKLWAETQETRRAGCVPNIWDDVLNVVGITWKLPLVISVYMGGVVFMWVRVYMHICGGQKSNLDELPWELSTVCLERGYLIDLGSPFRLLVDEQILGILLSMSLGLQTHVAP